MSKTAIVLVNYNDSRWLINWIVAMGRQHPEELIVVDDRSTDHSLLLLRELQKEYKFRIVENDGKRGPFNAVIKGCLATDAEFVSPWSCDDEPNDGYVYQMACAINDYPFVDLFSCNTKVIREGREYERILLPFDAYISPDYMVKLCRAGFARSFNVIGHMIRRRVVLENWMAGGKDMAVNFDALYAFSTMLSKGFVNLGDCLTTYRSYPNSFGASGNRKARTESIRISKRIFMSKGDPDLYERARASGLWGLKAQFLSRLALWMIRRIPKWARFKFYDWFFSYDWKCEKL